MNRHSPLPDLELAEDGTLLYNASPPLPEEHEQELVVVAPSSSTQPTRRLRQPCALDAVDRVEYGLDIEQFLSRFNAPPVPRRRTSQPPPLPPIPELDTEHLEFLDS